jgi:hypothetical protein
MSNSTAVNRLLRRSGLAAAALALVAGTSATVNLTAPTSAEAAPCPSPIFGMLLSSMPNKDMALGFANGTTNNAPLAMRDSSGLSRAEMWQEFPLSNGTVVLRNVNTDTGVFQAAVNGTSSASAVVAKFANNQDPTQQWRRDGGAFFTYTSKHSGKRLTAVPGASAPIGGKPFQQHLPGVGGDQFFRHQFVACP